ncbi:amidohydrolase family protein [Acrocarpospora macrocephala]|uniref:amidohydrolase family protein n=1 Tax=Acrocarpospora macrocephala TaxID=150177 RepID=UPI0012D32205|nr:amidohydrolase family protein [Acrocarpospora macrocephala]
MSTQVRESYASMCDETTDQAIPFAQHRELPSTRAELPPGTILASADSHLLEPADWTDRMPAKFRDRAPRAWVDSDELMRYSYDGAEVIDPFGACVSTGREGIHDLSARIADMDAEGIDKDLLFPQWSFAILAGVSEAHKDAPGRNPEYAMAYIRAYNKYVAETCAHYPDRLYGLGILNFWDSETAAENIAEIKELGLKGLVMPTNPPSVKYNEARLEPLWTAIEESGLPLSFHVGERVDMSGAGTLGTALMQNFHPYRRLWSLLTFSGILERHPELKVVFTEGQLHWIPGALQDADQFYESFGSLLEPKLAHTPSHYWFQNCYATFQEDEVGLGMLSQIGADRVMWSTDYPHSESVVGRCQDAAKAVATMASAEDTRAILGGTTMRLWDMAD